MNARDGGHWEGRCDGSEASQYDYCIQRLCRLSALASSEASRHRAQDPRGGEGCDTLPAMSSPETLKPRSSVKTLVDLASRQGEEPWLFFRPALDWRWQSYGRVMDRVARIVGDWRPLLATVATDAPLEVGPRLRFEDMVSVILASQVLARVTTRPVDGNEEASEVASAAARVSQPGESVLCAGRRLPLPAVRGPLESFEPRELSPSDLASLGDDGDPAPWTVVEPRFPPPEVLVGESKSGHPQGASHREVFVAQPETLWLSSSPEGLAPWSVLSAATLDAGAAWIIEPQWDAWIETVRWARPTLGLMTPDGARLLLERWTSKDRRHARWRRIVVFDPRLGRGGTVCPVPGDGEKVAWSEAFGAPVVTWSPRL